VCPGILKARSAEDLQPAGTSPRPPHCSLTEDGKGEGVHFNERKGQPAFTSLFAPGARKARRPASSLAGLLGIGSAR
jgi:hypothetical protein